MIRIFENNASQPTPPATKPELAPDTESNIRSLEQQRADLQAEQAILQTQWDEATRDLRELHAQVAASEGKTYPSSPLGIALKKARHSATELRDALDAKVAEIEKLSNQINAIKRKEPARLRREALEDCLPSLFDFIDRACVAARHEREFMELEGNVEQPVPWQLMLAGGEGVLVETLVSRWLEALRREGLRIPGEISDNARHLPAPASHYARIQTDVNHAAYASSCGAGNTRAAVAQARREGFRAARHL